MQEQTDKSFIKSMSIILIILVVFTIVIIFMARDIGFKDDEGNNASRQSTTEERIRPVAGAYTGEDGAAAIQQAAAAPAQTSASNEPVSTEQLYTSVCSACHAAGLVGAPRPGSPEMAQRTEKGMDVLMQSALNGLNAMPARGGRADLSDEQIQAIVEYMIQ